MGVGPLFTIGHSNLPLDRFLELLGRYQVTAVIDVRSIPYSKFAGQFNKKPLADFLKNNRIEYVFLGRELGGKPRAREFYDLWNQVDYRRIAQSPGFKEGLDRVLNGMRDYRIALMCSEENPARCHRSLLIAKELGNLGIEVLHIRHSGELEPGENPECRNQPGPVGPDQRSLF